MNTLIIIKNIIPDSAVYVGTATDPSEPIFYERRVMSGAVEFAYDYVGDQDVFVRVVNPGWKMYNKTHTIKQDGLLIELGNPEIDTAYIAEEKPNVKI